MYEQNKLAEAIMSGKMDEARELIKTGEKLSGQYVQNNKSQILSYVLRNQAFDLTDALIDGGLIETDVYEYDSFERSFFKTIVRELKGDEASISFFKSLLEKIEHKNDEVKDETLLGFCMKEGADIAVVRCLVDAGCDVRYKNNAERNLIYEVVNKNMLAPEKGLAYLSLLIAEGVDVNEKDIVGSTPLMAAVKDHKKDYLDLLLQNGANPNEQDKDGNTAFYMAVNGQQDAEMYELLKQYASPDFDLANKDGDHLLTGYLRMVGNGSERMLKLLRQLINDGADIYQSSPYYGKPKSGIDWLAEKSLDTLKAVWETGAIDINRQDNEGNILLHKVCGYNVNFDADAAKETYRKVKFLLENGADSMLANDKDETALMLAQQDNLKIKTVELLMSKR